MTITHFAEAFIVLIFFQQSCSNSMEKIKNRLCFEILVNDNVMCELCEVLLTCNNSYILLNMIKFRDYSKKKCLVLRILGTYIEGQLPFPPIGSCWLNVPTSNPF